MPRISPIAAPWCARSFKAEYSGKAPTLGKTLLKSARESSDKPAIMYTAYEEARLVSASLNDLETAFAVHEELNARVCANPQGFARDDQSHAKSASTMTPDNAVRSWTSSTSKPRPRSWINVWIRPSNCSSAMSRTSRGLSSTNPNARDILPRLAKTVGRTSGVCHESRPIQRHAVQNPDDGEANLDARKVSGPFQQGNYKLGLTYLAKGNDTEIREAANYELSIPAASPEFGKVGAAWWGSCQ